MDVRYEVGFGADRIRCYGPQEALEEITRRPEAQAWDYVDGRFVTVEELEERVQAGLDAEADYAESMSMTP